VYYIDGSSSGKGGIDGPDLQKNTQTTYSSAQQVELAVLIYLFQKITAKPLNIFSDSAYVVGLFPAIETSLISTTHKVTRTLLSTLQHLIQTHNYPFYITHIRAHSNLPCPLVQANDIADKLICTVFSSPEDPQHLHINANRLHLHYKIPPHTAHDIIKSCPVCAPLHCRSHPSGANP
jgi:hypothetical protein